MKNLLNIFFITTLVTFLIFNNIFGQLRLTVSTDKQIYDYGEPIIIVCSVKNITDTTFRVTAGCYNSCQAEFEFNNYQSDYWTACLPMLQELVFNPGQSRNYSWTILPDKFGLPDRDGIQKIVGHYFYKDLSDSIEISAPVFLGGQLNVGFNSSNDTLLFPLKDSLNVIVLSRFEYSGIKELWQIYGYQIDSLFEKLKNDSRFNSVEYNRLIEYDSITVTSIRTKPSSINSYYLSDVYPNPFNSRAKFYFDTPKTENINITMFDVLGKYVLKIYSGKIYKNQRKYFEVNGDYFASGIYFIVVDSPQYHKSRKLILLK
jgi:hypothetical protein